jgi:hypothetical protein
MAHPNELETDPRQRRNPYGTTQSGGSRYESGRDMPPPLRLLMRLHLSGVISDADLKAAKAK